MQEQNIKPASSDSVVSIQNLSKSYDQTRVVDNLSLTVQRGECFGLLGPNGAGKTTTLRILLGMTPPDSGQLSVLGHRIPEQAREMRSRIGVVPQTDNLDPDFTVSENLSTYASYFQLPPNQLKQRISELLEFAKLTNKAGHSIESLSGGMKRRLTLARALINDPELIILDEPTTGLDPQVRQLIWQHLRELKSAGQSLILTTHYMDEAQRLCDRLAIMDHGRIVVMGSPRQLIAEHIEPNVLEVTGTGLNHWRSSLDLESMGRFEVLGETLLIYTQDEKPLVDSLCQHSDVDFIHRRANLEDVFLKLTGRDLRE